MLPVTHGDRYTRLHVLLYTIILLACSMLPFVTRMSGLPYLVAAVALGIAFLYYAVRINTHYSDALARRTFRYSIVYLAALREVPTSLYEAAAIDGMGPIRRFMSVTLPMISPMILSTSSR